MNIWLFNPYGPLPGEGWRDYRCTLVARSLARRGHGVTWWTAAFAHQTKQFRCTGMETRDAGDFTIQLVPTTSYGQHVGPARLRFEWSFERALLDHARTAERPDVIIAADPPQFCGAAGRKIAAHHRVPLILDRLDLWPELFVAVSPGVLKPLVAAAVQPLLAIRRRNTRAAALVIAVAETYRRAAEVEGARKAVTIPIGVDCSLFRAVSRESAPQQLTAVYAGTLGQAYDLDTVIQAATLLARDNTPVQIVIAGAGPAEERLRATAAGSSNVRFAGRIDAADLPDLYSHAHIGLAPYAAGSNVALPLKMFDYLAAGLPVVTSLSGEAAERIRSTGAGMLYQPGNAQSLRNVLAELAGDRSTLTRMSGAATAAAAEFDTRVLYERYADEVEAVVQG